MDNSHVQRNAKLTHIYRFANKFLQEDFLSKKLKMKKKSLN